MSAIELSCGIGGLSLGLKNAGFELTLALDNWPPAIDLHRRNFETPANLADLSDILAVGRELSRLAPDIAIGRPPCQDFSAAGKL